MRTPSERRADERAEWRVSALRGAGEEGSATIECGRRADERAEWTVRPSARRVRRGARQGIRVLGLVAVLAVAVAGCSFKGVSSLPLPGGVDTGSDAYDVKIVFENVLDLVPQSQCRVNDVPVGKVTKIDLVNWRAVVTCRLRGSVGLPANAVATISQTSLLGEKYVALSAPQGQSPVGKLTQGAEIPLERTTRDTEVEEVLSAVSMLITGGGLEQLGTINHELNAALQGHTLQARDLINQTGTLVRSLDRQKRLIVSTIDKVDHLTSTLARHNTTIADTIDSSGPAVKILAQQRQDLTKLLVNMDKLGTVATRIINRSHDDTVANVKSLQSILENVDRASNVLPKVLAGLLSFPFPQTVNQAIKGDYGNLFITLDLNASDIAHNFLAGTPLEGVSKAVDKLQSALPPPHISIPDTPLGVLPPGTAPQQGGGLLGGILPPLGMQGEQSGDLGALLRGGTA